MTDRDDDGRCRDCGADIDHYNGCPSDPDPLAYTEAQLQAAVRDARDQAIEQCAQLAERQADSCDQYGPTTEGYSIRHLAGLLRSVRTPSEATNG